MKLDMNGVSVLSVALGVIDCDYTYAEFMLQPTEETDKEKHKKLVELMEKEDKLHWLVHDVMVCGTLDDTIEKLKLIGKLVQKVK